MSVIGMLRHLQLRHERPMRKSLLIAGLSLGLSLLVLGLIPSFSLAAPTWEVVVVDEGGRPLEGMLVRETWQNYSVQEQLHVAERHTDAYGQVSFPPQKTQCSVLREITGTIRARMRWTMHGGPSYGPHAYIFASGKGFFGTAITGTSVTAWTGSPPQMHSHVIVEHVVVRKPN